MGVGLYEFESHRPHKDSFQRLSFFVSMPRGFGGDGMRVLRLPRLRAPQYLRTIRAGVGCVRGASRAFGTLREIHRASECALQCPQRPIASRGEANLVSPSGFQKVNPLIYNALAKCNSRGEFHEARKTKSTADAMKDRTISDSGQ